MNRVLTVARLHVAGWPGQLGWPWAILASSFAINLALWSVLDDGGEDATTAGLVSLPLVVAVVVGQFVTRLLPLAMGLGCSRRSFLLATLLVAGAHSVLHGSALLVLESLERATGGWGTSLEYFGAFVPDGAGLATRWLVQVAPVVLASVGGLAVGVLLQRWGTNGLFVTATTLLLAGGGLAVLVTARGWWGDLGDALAALPAPALLVGAPLALSAVLAAASYVVLRRTSP